MLLFKKTVKNQATLAKIRKKTAGLDLSEKDIEDAIAWARRK